MQENNEGKYDEQEKEYTMKRTRDDKHLISIPLFNITELLFLYCIDRTYEWN